MTYAELLFKGSCVQRDGCEVHKGQENSLVRQLFADASKSLLLLATMLEASVDGGDTRYLTLFYILRQLVPLNVYDELGEDNVASVGKGAALS